MVGVVALLPFGDSAESFEFKSFRLGSSKRCFLSILGAVLDGDDEPDPLLEGTDPLLEGIAKDEFNEVVRE